jgi:hypothetical protein
MYQLVVHDGLHCSGLFYCITRSKIWFKMPYYITCYCTIFYFFWDYPLDFVFECFHVRFDTIVLAISVLRVPFISSTYPFADSWGPVSGEALRRWRGSRIRDYRPHYHAFSDQERGVHWSQEGYAKSGTWLVDMLYYCIRSMCWIALPQSVYGLEL